VSHFNIKFLIKLHHKEIILAEQNVLPIVTPTNIITRSKLCVWEYWTIQYSDTEGSTCVVNLVR